MSTIDYAKARELMVEQQIRPWDVFDPRVLAVLAEVPREDFVPAAHRTLAYADIALPLGHGEAMMKPVVEGRTLQALELSPGDDVLEIGTGSGFLAACMGRLAREVVSLERHADLADAARARLAAHGAGNVNVITADAFSWDASSLGSGRRFAAICVTGAVSAIPPRFIEWLQPDGRMFIVRGRSPAMEAVLLRNQSGSNQTSAPRIESPRLESLFETDLPYLAGAAPAPTFEL
jgi:protein-L-isoaspartate(D-aspartate) O-methyltransferase